MKILTAEQMREWDQFTISQTPIRSVDLMEQAAEACTRWLLDEFPESAFDVICGTGNNGGDGLAIARMLDAAGLEVRVFIAGNPATGPDDFQTNLQRLNASSCEIFHLRAGDLLPESEEDRILIDALFGTGINRPVEGWLAEIIGEINDSLQTVVSVDIPSGMHPDLEEPQNRPVVEADYTLTFECPKPAFLFAENITYTGEISYLNIGLLPDYLESADSSNMVMTEGLFDTLIPPRQRTGHKYDFGHVQVIAGSKGKMGAAILCSRAALRGGAGLVTASVPQCGYTIMQTAAPEVMCEVDAGSDALTSAGVLPKVTCMAIGPGIGLSPETILMLRRILQTTEIPLVIDADALSIIASRELPERIPAGTILTPHPGEFDRLFGKHSDSFSRLRTQREMSVRLQVTIVLKGTYTTITTPGGITWFNMSGNEGMATAGSGDVLTGMIAALAGRGIPTELAAACGVFLHGVAGDLAALDKGFEGVIAGDLIEQIPYAITMIREADSED